ncbi:hypothetical protein MJO28_006013 [Puccinia striiformis f. sp. tritici]|uniref:Uncharacterized protein n=1 Tax=Puccinia striiformis f. sp. tritici TaxID=168172 RepID=A0ACC0EHS3_9BASI|nr:hypothetical protein MJO28_006013 [Puccinia striiformis f. sp. tritici]
MFNDINSSNHAFGLRFRREEITRAGSRMVFLIVAVFITTIATLLVSLDISMNDDQTSILLIALTASHSYYKTLRSLRIPRHTTLGSMCIVRRPDR